MKTVELKVTPKPLILEKDMQGILKSVRPVPVYLVKLPDAVPVGKVLVHNNVKPARRQGTRGFR